MSVRLLIAILLSVSTLASAEIKQSIQLDLLNTLALGGPQDLYLASGLGQLNFQSVGNENVRAYLNLDADFTDRFDITVDRAFVKTRYQQLRLTVGKTRLSWGEGQAFNAGDVIMGGSDLNLDLTVSEYRSDSKWLLSMMQSTGRFSFLELVVIPPEPSSDPDIDPTLDRAEAAVRTRFQLAGLANTNVELGYAQQGRQQQPYVSLQGGKGINWHFSANLQPHNQANFSSGLYGIAKLGEQSTINYRTEVLYKTSGASEAQASGDYKTYGYLEMGLTRGSNKSYFSRNILSPIDMSALYLLGVNINLHQGLNFYGHLSVQQGGPDDTFSRYISGAQSITLGCRFIF